MCDFLARRHSGKIRRRGRRRGLRPPGVLARDAPGLDGQHVAERGLRPFLARRELVQRLVARIVRVDAKPWRERHAFGELGS